MVPNKTLLFYGGCIPVRLFIAASPLIVPASSLWILAIIFGIISIFFFNLWLFNYRQNATEASTTLKLKSEIPLFMNGLYTAHGTWWANARIVHAILYGVAAICLFPPTKRALCAFINKATTATDKNIPINAIASAILVADVGFGEIYRWLIVG